MKCADPRVEHVLVNYLSCHFSCLACRLFPQPPSSICHNAGKAGAARPATPMTPLSFLQTANVLEKLEARVPHMCCMAWIQQRGRSGALSPQLCCASIKEHSSPSCTAVLAPFAPSPRLLRSQCSTPPTAAHSRHKNR